MSFCGAPTPAAASQCWSAVKSHYVISLCIVMLRNITLLYVWYAECILDQLYRGTTESAKQPGRDSIHERAKRAFLEVTNLTPDAAVDDKENNDTKILVKMYKRYWHKLKSSNAGM